MLSVTAELYRHAPTSARPWSITWAIVTVFSTTVVGLIDGWTLRVLWWAAETIGIGQGLPLLLLRLKPRIGQPFYRFTAIVLYVGAPLGICAGVSSPFLFGVNQPATVSGYYGLAVGVAAVACYITAISMLLNGLYPLARILRRCRSGTTWMDTDRQTVAKALQENLLHYLGETLWESERTLLPKFKESAGETVRLMKHADPNVRSYAVIAGYVYWQLEADPQFVQACCDIAVRDPHPRPRAAAVLLLELVRSPTRDVLLALVTVVKDPRNPPGLRNQAYCIILTRRLAFSGTSDERSYVAKIQEKRRERQTLPAGEPEPLLEFDYGLIERYAALGTTALGTEHKL